MRVGLVALALAVSACTGAQAPVAKTFKLSNGTELPLLSGVTLMPACPPQSWRDSNTPDLVCLEFSGELVRAAPEEDVQNRYTQLLIQKGFEFEGGASVAYWFRWSQQDGCSRRLTIASAPKDIADRQGDWANADTYILVMGFDPPECQG